MNPGEGIDEGISDDGGYRIRFSRNRNRKGNGWKVGSLWVFRGR